MVSNIYNIYQIKDEIIDTLKNIIINNTDLKQQLKFILNCYPNLYKLFGNIIT